MAFTTTLVTLALIATVAAQYPIANPLATGIGGFNPYLGATGMTGINPFIAGSSPYGINPYQTGLTGINGLYGMPGFNGLSALGYPSFGMNTGFGFPTSLYGNPFTPINPYTRIPAIAY